MAVITFTQLDEDIFVVSHRVKGIGLRGKAMKLVYTKTASLCVAAGFTHMKILEQESDSGQLDDSANASIRAQFFFEGGGEHVSCEQNADEEYVQQASRKLAAEGHRLPDGETPVSEASESAGSVGTNVEESSCTIEQIAAMARAGLTDDQIRGACLGQSG